MNYCELENFHDKTLQNRVGKIKKNLPTILENPVIKEFLEIEENKQLLEEALRNPSEITLENWNQTFKEFHKINRIVRYISGLIRRYPIDYDKRVKARRRKYQSVPGYKLENSEQHRNNKDFFRDNENVETAVIVKEYKNQGMILFKNKQLERAVQKLNTKQKKILYFYYEEELNNREIAEIFGETEQNIAYWNKKTLKSLRNLV